MPVAKTQHQFLQAVSFNRTPPHLAVENRWTLRAPNRKPPLRRHGRPDWMTPHRTWRPKFAAHLLALCAVAMSGCASWEGPRIDPSGERLFIWPDEAPATTFGPATTAPPAWPTTPGPVAAPPVWPDPAPPSQSTPVAPTIVAPPVTTTVPPSTPPPVAVPPVAAPPPAAPVAAVPAVPVVVGQPSLRITPERVLAPVGSEVVLRAGICRSNGLLKPDERVEWLLARDGTGEFVDLSDRGKVDLFRWVWDTPRKVDNWYAIGTTTTRPVVLHRGTADPSDDVQVLGGEAWISVTSPAEGISYVTAYAPTVADWQYRRATATIYWVDAQWAFPPSTCVEPGQSHVLTTTVLRQSDGTPIPGWLVRYEVADGGGSLGYEATGVVEVPTDAAGRASVEVSPTDAGSGTTIINMVLIRPGQAGLTTSPPLEIGTGSATITWGTGGAAAPVTPPPISPAPPPSYPGAPAPSGTYTPPPEQPEPGQPELEVRLSRLGPEQVKVGDLARFQVVVTNRGTAPARRIEVLDRFDRGLSHPEALPNEFAVKYPTMRDLAPGESSTIPLSFEVVSAGRHCHEVTVTAEGGEEAIDRACVTAIEPAPGPAATLEVTKLGPTRHLVGELAQFKIVVKNTGHVAATNVEVIDQYDEALVPRLTEAGRQFLPDGRIMWQIDRLEAGERREFRVQCECVVPNRNSCNRVIVKADGGVNYAHEACLEILPQLPSTGPDTDSTPPAATSNLQVSIVETANPVKAGQRTTIYVYVENTGGRPERQVELWLMFPQEMTPDTSQIQPQGSFTLDGQEVRFNAIAELRPQERQTFVIPASVNRTGSVRIWARLNSADLAQPLTTQSNAIEIIPGP